MLRIFFVFVIIQLLPLTLSAQKLPDDDSLVTIKGQILGKRKKPVGGAVIEVFDKEKKIGNAISDINGNYTIKNIVYRSNLYPYIIVSNTGYPTHVAFMPIQLATVSHKIRLSMDKDADTLFVLYKPRCFPIEKSNKGHGNTFTINKRPLIQPFEYGTTTLTGEQIDKMAR